MPVGINYTLFLNLHVSKIFRKTGTSLSTFDPAIFAHFWTYLLFQKFCITFIWYRCYMSIEHIQTSNTVLQQINLFIMSSTLYTVVNTFF